MWVRLWLHLSSDWHQDLRIYGYKIANLPKLLILSLTYPEGILPKLWVFPEYCSKLKYEYTNPATGILHFCKQKLWPLQFRELTNSLSPTIFTDKQRYSDATWLNHGFDLVETVSPILRTRRRKPTYKFKKPPPLREGPNENHVNWFLIWI